MLNSTRCQSCGVVSWTICGIACANPHTDNTNQTDALKNKAFRNIVLTVGRIRRIVNKQSKMVSAASGNQELLRRGDFTAKDFYRRTSIKSVLAS